MLEKINALLWDAEASKVKEFEQIEKSLLENLFQEAFSRKLNKNCSQCWQDAYYELRWLRKKLLNMATLTKYKVLKPFEFQCNNVLVTSENLTDETAELALKHEYMAAYIEVLPVLPVETVAKKGGKK